MPSPSSVGRNLNADPFSGYLFIFRTRRGTAIRVLQYDGQGFWLATKRLSKGRFGGGPQARSLRERCARIRRNCCSRPVILKRKRHRHGVPCIHEERCQRIEKPLAFRFLLWHTDGKMASEWRYRGRVVTADDVTLIRQLIAENPSASRRRLSEKLCEVWQWKQANGCVARYGLPWPIAHVASGRPNRITARPLQNSQSVRGAGNSHTDAYRHGSNRGCPE